MWNTASYIDGLRRNVVNDDSLTSARKIILDPVLSKASNSIVMKFVKKNGVIYGIESLAKIQKDANCVEFLVKIVSNLAIELIDSHIGGPSWPEAKLMFCENIVAGEKILDPDVDNSFKKFRDRWKDRDRPIVCEVMFVTGFENGCNIGMFHSLWYSAT